MSSAMRDLWPDDIKAQDVFSPEEILQHQAELLGSKTNGVLAGHVAKLTGEDRIVLGFEVASSRSQSRVRLFEVHHRPELPYPAAIYPPDNDLPEYLQKEKVSHVLTAPGLAAQLLYGSRETNYWVAATPDEFSEKIGEVLKMPTVTATMLSLISEKRSNGGATE